MVKQKSVTQAVNKTKHYLSVKKKSTLRNLIYHHIIAEITESRTGTVIKENSELIMQ